MIAQRLKKTKFAVGDRPEKTAHVAYDRIGLAVDRPVDRLIKLDKIHVHVSI